MIRQGPSKTFRADDFEAKASPEKPKPMSPASQGSKNSRGGHRSEKDDIQQAEEGRGMSPSTSTRGGNEEKGHKSKKGLEQLLNEKKEKGVIPELGAPASASSHPLTMEKKTNMKGNWSIKENTWKPAIRIGATLTTCANRILLFGGYSKSALNEVAYLELKTASWKRIEDTKGAPPVARFGHTTAYYKGQLIIFGGEHKHSLEIKQREMFSDVWSYNIAKNEFTILTYGDKLLCEPRKNHIMALVGGDLMMHGGLNPKGYMLEDMISYNF
jgi:hypothetical protein